MFINLALTSHTLETIQQILTATPATNHCTTKHISHPILTLTMTQLHSLNGLIQANLDQNLTHRVIFHHLRITAMSTLLPSDRTLKTTLDNTIHILTPPRTGSATAPHHITYTSTLTHTIASPIFSMHVLGTSQHPIALLSLPVFRVNTLDPRGHGVA